MSSSVKVINTITETNSQGIIDAVNSLKASGHQTDSFTLASMTSSTSTTYDINNYKHVNIAVDTSMDANLTFQAQFSNNQTDWYYDYTASVYSTSNPDGTITVYQATYSTTQPYGRYMRVEYHNPNAASVNVKVNLNFLR